MKKKLLFFNFFIVIVFSPIQLLGSSPDNHEGLTRRTSTLARISQQRQPQSTFAIQMPIDITDTRVDRVVAEKKSCSVVKSCLAFWIIMAATLAGTAIYEATLINQNLQIPKLPSLPPVPPLPSVPLAPLLTNISNIVPVPVESLVTGFLSNLPTIPNVSNDLPTIPVAPLLTNISNIVPVPVESLVTELLSDLPTVPPILPPVPSLLTNASLVLPTLPTNLSINIPTLPIESVVTDLLSDLPTLPPILPPVPPLSTNTSLIVPTLPPVLPTIPPALPTLPPIVPIPTEDEESSLLN